MESVIIAINLKENQADATAAAEYTKDLNTLSQAQLLSQQIANLKEGAATLGTEFLKQRSVITVRNHEALNVNAKTTVHTAESHNIVVETADDPNPTCSLTLNDQFVLVQYGLPGLNPSMKLDSTGITLLAGDPVGLTPLLGPDNPETGITLQAGPRGWGPASHSTRPMESRFGLGNGV